MIASPIEEDHIRLRHILARSRLTVRGVFSCREARVLMHEDQPAVVICERDFADGNWKQILDALVFLKSPPALIVMSRLSDESLWSAVLNLGGYDVLNKPFDEKEVLRVVNLAVRAWGCQRRQGKLVLVESPEERPIQCSPSAKEVGGISGEGRGKNMFQNLVERIRRIREGSTAQSDYVIQNAVVWFSAFLVTFLLFWGLQIGILFGE